MSPKNADDFKTCAAGADQTPARLLRPSRAAQDTVMHLANWASLFGAPNGWRLDPGNKLVKDVETP